MLNQKGNMMNEFKFWTLLVGVWGLAVSAAVVETTTDQTAAGDWEVTVDAGSSNVVSVVQSGAGRIVKKGAGTLVLKTDNTFTGGVELQAGFLRVEHDHALGSGTLTILGQRSDYTGYCELQIMGAGPGDASVLTIPNDIHVTGNTTGQYPALMAFGQNSVLTGTITADQDFVFAEDYAAAKAIHSSQYNRYTVVVSLTFGELNVAGTLGNNGMTRWVFNGPVKTPVFDVTISRPKRPGDDSWDSNGNAHSAFQFNVPCQIGQIITGRHPFYCNAENVLPGTIFSPVTRFGKVANYLNFNGYGSKTAWNQVLGGLAGDPLESDDTQYTWQVNESKGTATLTLTGVEPDEGEVKKELVTSISLNNGLSVVVDADPGFMQTVSNRIHTMNGTITARSGGFRVAGTATFSNVTAIVVGKNGRFEQSSIIPGAFNKVTSLTVEGAFRAETLNAFQRNSKIALALASDASFSVAEGGQLIVTSFKLDGVAQLPGTYTHANCPPLAEGVRVVLHPAIYAAAAVWTGASGTDTLLGTPENWLNVPDPLDVTRGTLAVEIGSGATENGARMTYQGNASLYSITNLIPFTAGSGSVCTPFTIGPAAPGDTLTLHHGLFSNLGGQIVLEGHIALPEGKSSGSAVATNPLIIYYIVPFYKASETPQGVIESSRSAGGTGSAPLVLRNAVVDLPIRVRVSTVQATTLLAAPGSTNVVNGPVVGTDYQASLGAAENGVLELRGGFESAQTYRFVGPGEIRIVDKPVKDLGAFLEKGVHLVLDAEGNVFTGNTAREGLGLTSGVLEFRRNGCFNAGDLQLYFSGNATVNAAETGIEFNATTQRVGIARFNNVASTALLHGDYPAMLEITGQVREGATEKYVYASTNIMHVTGGLGFHVCGDTTFPIGKFDHTSCGDLEASAGTLELLADASWRCGTNFTARGTGTLKFHNARQIDRSFAQLHFADDGAVSIPAGVTLSVAAADVAGEPVPMGIYASGLTTGALANRVTGGGVLQVGRCGTLIIFK